MSSEAARPEPQAPAFRHHLGALLLLPLLGLLVGVIATVYAQFDGTHGFDYGGHLDYVRYLDFTARIPLANRGWQMYHPPLYYASTALLFEALHRLGASLTITDAGRWLATAAWVAQGALAAAAVRVWRGSWLGAAVAAAVVWLLPGQSMMGSMIYNETFTGFGVAIIVLGIALWGRSWGWALGLLAIGIPMAALSKYSGLAAAAGAIVFVGWQLRRRAWPALAALLPGLLAVGIFYWHNWHRLGTPLPLNSTLFNLKSWDPLRWGHPAGFYTRVDLQACAAPVSFIGGFWKWFFALDCFKLAPWRSTMDPLLLAAALLLTLVAIAAVAWLLIDWKTDLSRLILAAVPAAVLVAFVLYVIRVPSATTDKGVYALTIVAPLAVAIGMFCSRWVKSTAASAVVYILLVGWSTVMAHASGLA